MQHIAAKSADWWLCLCGNTADQHGFQPCNSEGDAVDPTPAEWTTDWYVCEACGRIIRQSDLRVVGVRFRNTLSPTDKGIIFADKTRLLPSPRRPTQTEKEQLLQVYRDYYELGDYHLPEDTAWELINDVYMAVFEPYGYRTHDNSGYWGKIMLIVWPGSPAYHEAYIWQDGQLMRVEQCPVIEDAIHLL